MDVEFVAPSEVINRLMKMHYPGKKRGSERRVRMALIGALRSGHVAWRCEKWFEQYTSDGGATFDENGGWTTSEPKWGWPADFWQPALAADNDCWAGNFFNTFGTVSQRTASGPVRLWLERNGEGHAGWQRAAGKVEVNWTDVNELLAGGGWQVWAPPKVNESRAPLAAHYQNALIRMIGRIARDSGVITSRANLSDALFDEFEFGGRTPDESELRKLVRQIWLACQPVDEPPPPSN